VNNKKLGRRKNSFQWRLSANSFCGQILNNKINYFLCVILVITEIHKDMASFSSVPHRAM
jgi:hypothetical protein